MELSFIVLTHRRTEALLRLCLASIAPEKRPAGTEVLVGYNEAGPEAEAAQERLSKEFPWARWHALPGLDRGEARNRLVAQAKGVYLHFLDDDAECPEGFTARLLALWARWPKAAAVGGPNVGPADAPAFERAVEFLLTSPLGAGPMRCRYRRAGKEGPRESWRFMLTNAGARRSVFVQARLSFPRGCASAEENLLLHQIEKNVGPCVFDPELYVLHRRRPTLALFLSQVRGNARGRGEITRVAPSTLQAAVLAPFALLLPAALAVYALALAFETARLAMKDPAAALHLPLALPAAHAAYALGLVEGVLRGPKHAERLSSDLRDVAAR